MASTLARVELEALPLEGHRSFLALDAGRTGVWFLKYRGCLHFLPLLVATVSHCHTASNDIHDRCSGFIDDPN